MHNSFLKPATFMQSKQEAGYKNGRHHRAWVIIRKTDSLKLAQEFKEFKNSQHLKIICFIKLFLTNVLCQNSMVYKK